MISVPLLHICPLRLCAPLMSVPLLTIWHVSMPLLHKVHDMCASRRNVMFWRQIWPSTWGRIWACRHAQCFYQDIFACYTSLLNRAVARDLWPSSLVIHQPSFPNWIKVSAVSSSKFKHCFYNFSQIFNEDNVGFSHSLFWYKIPIYHGQGHKWPFGVGQKDFEFMKS